MQKVKFALLFIHFFIFYGQSVLASNLTGIRGSFLSFKQDPFYSKESESYQYISDGLMIIINGFIK